MRWSWEASQEVLKEHRWAVEGEGSGPQAPLRLALSLPQP